MVAQKQKRAVGTTHKKRHGHHHKQGKHYMKVYWPYVPITLIIAIGLIAGNWQPQTRNGVLAYATEMGVDTLLASTNNERINQKQAALKLNPKLTAAAQAKANDMIARDYWAHNTPDGQEPWTFVQAAGYQYLKAGENLAYGFNSSKDTISGWMHSQSHRENLLDGNYREVGFGFANAKNYNNAGPETVVVAMYGTPPDARITLPTTTAAANGATPITSLAPLQNEPKALGISRISTLTGGQLPWATFAVGMMSGLVMAFVILRHSIAFHKLIRRGEDFIIHHPWADIALVAFVMVGYVLSQTEGVIR